eukprot:scaffold52888_cov70-Phaeocystis_antarctica.AAC.12
MDDLSGVLVERGVWCFLAPLRLRVRNDHAARLGIRHVDEHGAGEAFGVHANAVGHPQQNTVVIAVTFTYPEGDVSSRKKSTQPIPVSLSCSEWPPKVTRSRSFCLCASGCVPSPSTSFLSTQVGGVVSIRAWDGAHTVSVRAPLVHFKLVNTLASCVENVAATFAWSLSATAMVGPAVEIVAVAEGAERDLGQRRARLQVFARWHQREVQGDHANVRPQPVVLAVSYPRIRPRWRKRGVGGRLGGQHHTIGSTRRISDKIGRSACRGGPVGANRFGGDARHEPRLVAQLNDDLPHR